MLGSLMFAAQVAMEVIPNVHLTGMLTILFTAVFRKKALIPLYLYVFLSGSRWGFGFSWFPYLYVWLVLWGLAMLVPQKLSPKIKGVLYVVIGFLHGILFGVLYAPAQALLFHLDFKGTMAWIAVGFPWDVVHGVGNGVFCILVYPLSLLLQRLIQRTKPKST